MQAAATQTTGGTAYHIGRIPVATPSREAVSCANTKRGSSMLFDKGEGDVPNTENHTPTTLKAGERG